MVIGDVKDAKQAEFLHELRAMFQERSNIWALSERYYAVLITLSEDQRLAA